MALEKVKELTTQLGKAISLTIDKDNPDEITGRIVELSSLQGTASYTVSLAGMTLNAKILELTEDSKYSNLGATDKKMVFNGKARQEIFFKDLAEAQLKSIHYSIEAMRSLLSYLKSEKEHSKFAV